MLDYPYSARGDARAIYPHLRRAHPDMPAARAWSWAKHEAEVDRVMSEVDWDHEPESTMHSAPDVVGALPDGVEITIYWDNEPYDWGDVEPTKRDMDNLSVIGVGARVAGESEDACMRWYDGRGGSFYGPCTVWGVGFTHGDAAREAVSVALESGFIDAARNELRERAYWAARDVVTVDA